MLSNRKLNNRYLQTTGTGTCFLQELDHPVKTDNNNKEEMSFQCWNIGVYKCETASVLVEDITFPLNIAT